MAIPFIGEEIAHSIVNYFENPVNIQLIASLRQAGLQLSKPTTSAPDQALPLSGKNFLISGTFQQFEREELKDLIKEKGGNLLTGVSSKLDYLVAGHNPGPSKMEQAQTMGIAIIDEAQILHMLQG
jgi:DNA ligase (NAD+)